MLVKNKKKGLIKMPKKENEVKLFTKGSFDYIVLIVVLILVSLGLIMVLSASSATALSEGKDSYSYFSYCCWFRFSSAWWCFQK